MGLQADADELRRQDDELREHLSLTEEQRERDAACVMADERDAQQARSALLDLAAETLSTALVMLAASYAEDARRVGRRLEDRRNVYRCTRDCCGRPVTQDVAWGVTPAYIGCPNRECPGPAMSSFYDWSPADGAPTAERYRPDETELRAMLDHSDLVLEHVARGGLLKRDRHAGVLTDPFEVTDDGSAYKAAMIAAGIPEDCVGPPTWEVRCKRCDRSFEHDPEKRRLPRCPGCGAEAVEL